VVGSAPHVVHHRLHVQADRTPGDRTKSRFLGELWKEVQRRGPLPAGLRPEAVIPHGLLTVSDGPFAWPLFKVTEKLGGYAATADDEGRAKLNMSIAMAQEIGEAAEEATTRK